MIFGKEDRYSLSYDNVSVGLHVVIVSKRMQLSSNFLDRHGRSITLVFIEPHCHYELLNGTPAAGTPAAGR